MDKVGFNHTVQFEEPQTLAQSVRNFVESYAPSWGKTFSVIEKAEDGSFLVQEKDSPKSWIGTTLKVASYVTLILPLLALLAKAILRCTKTFHVIKEQNLTAEQAFSVLCIWNVFNIFSTTTGCPKIPLSPDVDCIEKAKDFGAFIRDNKATIEEDYLDNDFPGEIVLDLSDLHLTFLPKELSVLNGITGLNLMGNRIKTLPDWVNRGTFPRLTTIYIGSNTQLAKERLSMEGITMRVGEDEMSDTDDDDSGLDEPLLNEGSGPNAAASAAARIAAAGATGWSPSRLVPRSKDPALPPAEFRDGSAPPIYGAWATRTS